MGAKLGGEFNDINMTPLIDIVLVVLIIMMVNMPIEVQELGVKLPNPNAEPPPPQPNPPEQLLIAVYEDEQVALNREIMPELKLREQLNRRVPLLAKKNVFVDAHPNVPLKLVTDMVDIAREAGAEKVGFAKLKPEGPKPAIRVSTGAMKRGIIPGNPLINELRKEDPVLDNVKAYESLQRILPTLDGCYAAALGTNPSLTGVYTIDIAVGPDGSQLEPPKIHSDTLGDANVRTCAEQTLPAIRFERLGQGNTATVRYSLLFSPG